MYKMELVQNLPDDIILHIYTKLLKRYRYDKGTLVRLVDFEKYRFLEKYVCRQICKVYPTHQTEKRYRIQYKLSNLCEISNRKESFIDDDMICIELTEYENSVHYDVVRFRLKKIECLNKEKKTYFSSVHLLFHVFMLFLLVTTMSSLPPTVF
jgi:hypothetical protein